MKKKMVTMLMIGTMAVMTACGTASKNDTVSDTTTVETDGNVKEDKSENDTKKDDAEVVSVDDVKFNQFDMYVKGGGTYITKQHYDESNVSGSITQDGENIYMFDFDKPYFYMKSHGIKYINENVEYDNTSDKYYDTKNDIVYIDSDKTDQIIKKEIKDIKGAECLAESYHYIFELPWTLESETDNEYIFTLPENTDFTKILDTRDIAYDDTTTFSNISASYVYNKNGTKLQSIVIKFDLEQIDDEGNPYTPHYSFSLTSSDLGNTTVEIPEDIINNAVEE